MQARQVPLAFCCLTLFVGMLRAQQVIKPPNQDVSLIERWRWAMTEGARSISEKEFWVGYSIKRLMNEDSYVSSGTMFSGWSNNRRTLYDVIAGTDSLKTNENRTWGYARRTSIMKKLKDVALLFRVSGTPSETGSLQRLEMSNMELSVDLKNKPLVWLGDANHEQSVELLKSMFERASTSKLKKDFVEAIGIHHSSGETFTFLGSVSRGEEVDDVRSQAVFWMGQQNYPDALRVLLDIAQNDRSVKVRDQAVFAISQLESDESTEALITLARKAGDSKVRAKAAFWLGQKASREAVSTLESIITNDEETDVQRQALFGLAQDHSKEGLDRLIKIAESHPNPRIRKQAIQCLGQSDDPRALDVLIGIVKK